MEFSCSIPLVLLLAIALVQDVTGAAKKPASCRPEFDAYGDHTMCKDDSDKVESFGVSNEDKKVIVDYHNKVRREVQPPATDLTELTWDDNLAEVAQKLTKQCRMYHDKNRRIPSYGIGIGQNLAAGQGDWAGAMEAWFNEVNLYKYGEDANVYLGPQGWKKIGHYTQLVSNQTSRVGCGFAKCKDVPYGRFYACNYATGQGSTQYPYTKGKQCSACTDSCKDGLCGCGGQLCFNHGSLDINTCKCKCQTIYNSKGDCSELICPEKDNWNCKDKNACKIYYNIPYECPNFCGVCPVNAKTNTPAGSGATNNDANNGDSTPNKPTTTTTTTTTTTPPPFVSTSNCIFTGQRLTVDQCKGYGDRGSDTRHCKNKGGSFTCNDCTKYYNVKTDYCPVMCGMCDPPCGMVCQNGGTLDPDTCTCACKGLYHGNLCQSLDCSQPDPWYCKQWPFQYCTDYDNVPYDCPKMCKKC